MHNKLSTTALAGVLALTTSGSDSTKTQPSPITFSPKKPALASPQKPATLVRNSQKPNFPPGLIQTTDIDQRLKQVQEGRPDPFTGVFPQIEVAPKPQKLFPDLPELPTVKSMPAATKPTPPSTDGAKGVAVEGVVQAGDESHAIIKLPQDSTSRYVSEGQQLSGGELLVKRIEIPLDSDPVVILEQNGIEIAKAVGEPVDLKQTDESTDIASSQGASSDSLASDSLASDPAESEETDKSTDTVVSSSPVQKSDSETGESGASNSDDASDSFSSDSSAVEPDEVTQPIEEYTAAIPVPSLPLLSSSLKKSVPPAPTNSKPSVAIASGVEDHLSQTVLSSSEEDLVRSDLASRERVGQDQVASYQYTSSSDLLENQPHMANANINDLTLRQQLIEQLRTNSSSPVGNRIESNSSQNLQANVDGTPKQQLINQLRSEKPLPTSNKVLTQKDSRVLVHKQQLINQLRFGKAMPINN